MAVEIRAGQHHEFGQVCAGVYCSRLPRAVDVPIAEKERGNPNDETAAMTDTRTEKTLLQRLRDYARVFKDYVEPPFWPTLGTEAADEIERLQCELEGQRDITDREHAEAERLRGLLVNYQASMDDANRIANENQRLQRELSESGTAYGRDVMSMAQERNKALAEVERLREHVWACPLGWLDNKLLWFKGTTEPEVIAWLAKLRELVGLEPQPGGGP
jgi:hypothetical protein